MADDLRALAEREAACRNCDLYQDATQVVPGQGGATARLMLVGEQPGDQEDKQGAPFVGPAGRVLDEALERAGIDRASVFLTNAVKHFKWQPRGKARIHKKPSAGEIDACHPWLERELAIVQPAIVVAMGATAARGVFGRPMKVGDSRGRVHEVEAVGAVVVTIHPSAVLRAKEREQRDELLGSLVTDLELAARSV
jgi:DNA polymerase